MISEQLKEFFDTSEDETGLGSEESFEYDEEGEFIHQTSQKSDSNNLKDGSEEDATDAEDDSSDGASDAEENLGSTNDPVSARIQALESSFDQLLETVQTIANAIKGGGKQKVEEEVDDDEDFDFTDAKSLKSSLKSMIQEAVAQAVAPIQTTTKEQRYRNEIHDLQNRYGVEFTNSINDIKQVLEINPDIGITKAFDLVRNIKKNADVKPKATKQDSDIQQKPKAMPKEDLIQKASNLKTESGVAPQKTTAEQRASSFRDAFNAAWEKVVEE